MVGVLLVACTPATARTTAELQDSYGPLVSDLQTELRTRLPDLTWQETTAEARRDGNACLVQLRTSGTSRGPRAEQAAGLLETVNGTLAKHGFAEQDRFRDNPGGWLVLDSKDPSGATFEFAAKAGVRLSVTAPGKPEACGP